MQKYTWRVKYNLQYIIYNIYQNTSLYKTIWSLDVVFVGHTIAEYTISHLSFLVRCIHYIYTLDITVLVNSFQTLTHDRQLLLSTPDIRGFDHLSDLDCNIGILVGSNSATDSTMPA